MTIPAELRAWAMFYRALAEMARARGEAAQGCDIRAHVTEVGVHIRAALRFDETADDYVLAARKIEEAAAGVLRVVGP